MKRNAVIAGGVVILVASIALAYWLLRGPRPLVYSGTVETREIEVGSKVGGRVTDVAVEEGQMVKASTMLVRFEADELKAQLAQSRASADQAEADLAKMEHGNRPEEIAQAEATARAQQAAYEAAKSGPRTQELAQAQADYDAAQADAINAEATFKRMAMLVRGETISRQQYDDALAKRDAMAQKSESAR
ncbi:biotin/lipoyl-binding protein, partial [Terriglobus sp. YAF25]